MLTHPQRNMEKYMISSLVNDKYMERANQTSYNIFIWALMPIILFSLASVAIPYLIEKIDIQTNSERNSDWVTSILNNDIKFQEVDSISMPHTFSRMNIYCPVKHLFPTVKCKNIILYHTKGMDKYILTIYTNANMPIAIDSLNYNHGEWIGFNMQNGREVKLGKMIGSPNLNENIMDIPSTYINVLSILTLGIMLVCLGVLLWEWYIPNNFGKFIFFLLICFSGICIGLLIDSFRGIRVQSAFMPEIVSLLFTISEIAIIFSVFNIIHQRNFFNGKKNI